MAQYSEHTVDLAGRLLDTYLANETTDEETLSPPVISQTDDIGACAPYVSLLKTITGEARGTDLQISAETALPYETFKRLNINKDVHDFKITTLLKDRKQAAHALSRYDSFFDITAGFNSLTDLIRSTLSDGGTTVASAVRIMREKIERVDPAVKRIDRGNILPTIIRDLQTLETAPVTTQATIQVNGYPTTSPFGWRKDPKKGTPQFHDGLDIGMAQQSPVCAITDGIIRTYVTNLNTEPGSMTGYAVYIEHKLDGHTFFSNYFHLHVTSLPVFDQHPVGTRVRAGQIIGYSGKTGYVTGAHLHLGIFTRLTGATGELDHFGIRYYDTGQYGGYRRRNYDPVGFMQKKPEYSIALARSGQVVFSSSPSGATVITTGLDKIRLKLEEIALSIYRTSFAEFTRFLTNDISMKVESVDLNWKPGTSAFIPLEGENAPVVQSTGGRNVQFQIRLREANIVTLAKLSLMFRVTNQDDKLLSMIRVARSSYRSSGPSRNRLKYMHTYINQESVQHMLEEAAGVRKPVRLDEPVRIKNDILNSLGLETFQPSGMELQSDPNHPGVFSVILTFNYINLGYRGNESLRREKQGMNVPVLSVAYRMPRPSDEQPNTAANEPQLALSHTLANISTRYGLAELVPLFTLYKLNNLRKHLDTIAASDDPVLNVDDPATAALLNMNADQWQAMVNHMYTDSDNYSTLSRTVGEGLMDGVASGMTVYLSYQATRAARDIGDLTSTSWFRETFGPNSQAMHAANKLTKVRSFGHTIANVVKTAAVLAGTAATGYTALSSFLGTERIGTASPNGHNALVFLIPHLAPFMIYDMIREYIVAVKNNAIDEYIVAIAQGARELLVASVEMENQDNVMAYALPRSGVKVVAAGRTYTIRHMVLKHHAGGIHRDGILSTGLGNLQNTFTRNLERARSFSEQDGALAMPVIASNTIGMWTVEAMSNMASLSHHLNYNGNIGKFAETALFLERTVSAREHAADIIANLCTSSMLDVMAAGMVVQMRDIAGMRRFFTGTDTQHEALRDGMMVFAQTIRDARIEISRYGYGHQMLSGMFVGNTFTTPGIRKGYCNAMLAVLTEIERMAVAPRQPQYYTSLGLTAYSLDSVVSAYEITGTVNPTRVRVMVDTAKAIAGTVITGLENMMEFLILDIVAYFSRRQGYGIAAKCFKWIEAILFLYDIFKVLKDLMANRVNVLIRIKNLFLLSQWLANRIREGLDGAMYMKMCLASDIWIAAALQYGNDASDSSMSSYIDYPIVVLNTRPAMPDFYIYKIGMIMSSYREMQTQIDDIVGLSEQRFTDNESMNFEHLKRRALDMMQGNVRMLLERIETEIVRIVMEYSIEGNRCVNNTTVFTSLSAAAKTRAVREYAEIGRGINYALCGSQHPTMGFLHVKVVSADGAVTATSGIPEPSRSALTMEISLNGTVRIDKNEMFSTIVDDNDFQDIATNPTKITQNIYEFTSTAHKRSVLSFVATRLLTLTSELRQNAVVANNEIARMMPNTIGYFMMVKALVGNSMHAMGRPGMALLKNQLQTIGYTALKRAAFFRTGYMYPTIKLYFIEEDSEAYYLFDDLYSYASIVWVDIHGSEDSPVQTCVLKVSNLYGVLTNMLSDRMNHEANFFTEFHEDAPINAIMLRPGAKIKIQLGNTPILTEEDTAFTGEITSIIPDTITTIEAQGFGSVFLEEITYGKMKTYPSETDAESGIAAQARVIVGRIATSILETVTLTDDGYLKPIKRIKDIVSHVLHDVTAISTKLNDYTVNTALDAEMDGEFTTATTELTTAIRDKLVPGLSRAFFENIGADLSVAVNNQLFENVHICGDRNSNRYWSIFSERGSWASYNETAWDILTNINLLLPSNVLTVRPFDTRGTLVWGEPDDYYRFRRSTDLHSLISVSLVNKLRTADDTTDPKCKFIGDFLIGALQGHDSYQHASALSLLTLVAYHAQKIMSAFRESSVPETVKIKFDDPYRLNLARAAAWLGYNVGRPFWQSAPTGPPSTSLSTINTSLATALQSLKTVKWHVNEINTAVAKSSTNTGTIQNYLGTLSMADIARKCNEYALNEHKVAMALSIEFACEHIVRYVLTTALGRSTSHKMISNFHIKLSGHDIVKNEIELVSPYNTVRVARPTDNTDADELRSMLASKREEGTPIPVHYALKPWSMKVYSTYFENMNCFPSARTSTESMVTASVLTNLLKDTYAGSLTVLGDTKIFDHDRALIWDENRDMFGILEVKDYTHTFNASEGFLTRISPRMITRNDNMLTDVAADSAFWWGGLMGSFAMVGAAAYLMKKGYKQSRKLMQYQQLARNERASVASTIANNTRSVMDRIRTIIPGLGAVRETSSASLDTLIARNSDAVKKGILSLLRTRKHMEDAVTDSAVLSRLTSGINTVLLREVLAARQTAASTLSNETMQVIAKQVFRETQRQMSRTGVSLHIANDRFGTVLRHDVIERITAQIMQTSEVQALQSVGGLTPAVRSEISTIINAAFPETSFRVSLASAAAMRQVAGSDAALVRAVDDMSDYFLLGRTGIAKILSQAGQFAGVLLGANMLMDSGRDIVSMYLLTKLTADNVTISPLFCQGEPFLAGLEGMTKKDGQQAGFVDVLKARFSNMGEALYHNVTDPISEALYEFHREYYRQSNH